MTEYTKTLAAAPEGKLASALALARYGFNVFPLRPNSKVPLIENWKNLAANDEAQIKAWWSAEPQANIGVSTESLLVIDVDPRNGGDATFKTLVETGGPIGEKFPLTVAAITQSNGSHIFYGLRPHTTVRGGANKLGPGVDVKSYGGYVVGAGSTIDGRPYRWNRDYGPGEKEVAWAPEWLIERCKKPTAKNAASGERIIEEDDTALRLAGDYIRDQAPDAVQGGRDNTAYTVAARLYDFGVSRETAHELLAEWNENCCHPPLEPDAIERIAWSAQRNRENAIGAKHPSAPGFEPASIKPKKITAALAVDNAGEWDAPTDLWNTDDALPDFDLSIFPAPVAQWVADEAKRKGVAVGTVAIPALIMFSAATPAQATVQVKQHDTGHVTRAILWGAVVGEVSARKTPALGLIRGPIESVEREWMQKNAAAQQQYAKALAAWKAKGKDGEAGDEPTRPPILRKLVEDATTERLAVVLQDNPAGLLSFHDELSGWIASQDAYRQNHKKVSFDAAFWLKAKDGSAHAVDRMSRDSVFVPSVAVSVLGGIQPGVIKNVVKEFSSNGMLQRFLLAIAPAAIEAEDREPHKVAKVIEHAVRRLMTLDFKNTFTGPPIFKFCPDADAVRKRLLAFVQGLIDDPDIPSPVRGWLGKCENEWARVAFVLHMMDFATRDAVETAPSIAPLADDPLAGDPLGGDLRVNGPFSENGSGLPPLVISEATAQAAFRFLTEFQFQHQLVFYRSVVGVNAESEKAAKNIASFILRNDLTEITERKIQQSVGGLGGGGEQMRLRHEAINILNLNGWLHPVGFHTTKGHANKFAINPMVHDERFSEITKKEIDRCETAKRRIAHDAEVRRAEKEYSHD